MSNYNIEVKQRFGDTDAYKEYAQKTTNYTKDKWQAVKDGLMAIFSKFAECKKNGNTADSDNAQSLVKVLKEYITKNYYTCEKEVLAVLGQMYITDKRFQANIDKHATGTAEFVSRAINIFTNKNR